LLIVHRSLADFSQSGASDPKMTFIGCVPIAAHRLLPTPYSLLPIACRLPLIACRLSCTAYPTEANIRAALMIPSQSPHKQRREAHGPSQLIAIGERKLSYPSTQVTNLPNLVESAELIELAEPIELAELTELTESAELIELAKLSGFGSTVLRKI
jgi:hypothetical protein